MTVTVCLPATEVISIDAMASVNTVVWWCRLCDHHGTATTRLTPMVMILTATVTPIAGTGAADG